MNRNCWIAIWFSYAQMSHFSCWLICLVLMNEQLITVSFPIKINCFKSSSRIASRDVNDAVEPMQTIAIWYQILFSWFSRPRAYAFFCAIWLDVGCCSLSTRHTCRINLCEKFIRMIFRIDFCRIANFNCSMTSFLSFGLGADDVLRFFLCDLTRVN